jgi:ankyrin repeat protein
MEISNILEMDNVHLLKSFVQNDKNILKTLDDDENNLLILALKKNLSDEVIEYLVSEIDPNDENDGGITPIFIAIQKGRINWVERFLEIGIDPSFSGRESGFTPLMEAVVSDQPEIIEFLLKKGAEKNVRDRHGYSAFDYAKKMRREELINILS